MQNVRKSSEKCREKPIVCHKHAHLCNIACTLPPRTITPTQAMRGLRVPHTKVLPHICRIYV